MRQRHKCLAQPQPCKPDIVLHHLVAAGIAMLGTKAPEDPLRRLPLLHRRLPVRRQDCIDHRNQWTKLQPCRGLLAPLPGRHRKLADLRNRLPVQTKNPRSLPPAPPLDKYKLPNRRINLHHKPPVALHLERGNPTSGWFLRRQAAALCRRSLAYFCTAAYSHRCLRARAADRVKCHDKNRDGLPRGHRLKHSYYSRVGASGIPGAVHSKFV